jgi:Tol biopolymer transport system component
MPISVGARFGAYEVTSPLGAGGMGEVYRARDTNLKRDAALKALPAEVANDVDRLARLEREAEVLAALNHPNIAQIYGLERRDGTTVLAMEFVEGSTLAERISRGPIPLDEALRVASQIAAALEAAHERGIVHRDLKPANIKLRPDGVVKVLDFGIAKALDSRLTTGPGPAALTTPAMTEAGTVLGTAAYMSPEQARGKPVDRRTDIWAFGCVLYEMLTGRPAFLGEDVTTTLARVLQGSADLSALPSDVPAWVFRTLELCFEKDARKRIADMHDVTLALAGTFAVSSSAAAPLWRRALPFAATLVAGSLLASGYFLGTTPPAVPVGAAAPAPVSRFVITPPSTAPLANQGSIDLAISPDGRRIAYLAVKPESGRVEIYVRELEALEARPIPGTEGPNIGLWNPFFSPDGESIGYVVPGRGLISAGIDGRPPIKIADGPDPFFGAWWADDNTVIYSTPLRLQRVSAAGGGTPAALMPQRPTGAVGVPVLLPGGRAVLFHVVGAAAGRGVSVLDLDTGDEKAVIEGASFPVYVDTGHLVFFRGDTLMAVPFDAAALAVTGEPVALVQGIRHPSGGAPDFALSRNGTLVYVPSAAEPTSELAVVWVDRTGQVTGRAVPDLVANPRDPRLSPDGTRLLLVTGPENDGHLWNYDLSGRPPIPLALSTDNQSPVWSPDGKQIAFHTLPLNATVTLLADGSERTPRSLSSELYVDPHVWSAAGELVVTRFGNRGDIAAIPVAATGEVRDVAATDSSEYDPALSPNGRWLAYVSDRSGQNEIWVQEYPEGAPVRVSSNGGHEPLWSADGRELFYREGDAVMVVAVETDDEFSFAAPTLLFSGPYVQRSGSVSRGYDVARDGRFLMILQGEENRAVAPASIVVVQNFGEELKQRVRPSGR